MKFIATINILGKQSKFAVLHSECPPQLCRSYELFWEGCMSYC